MLKVRPLVCKYWWCKDSLPQITLYLKSNSCLNGQRC